MALVEIGKGNVTAAIDTKGSQLRSLTREGREYLWQADPRWWGKSAPVLFPIVGTLRNNEATSAEGHCHMGRHGLARNYEHEVIERTDSSVTLNFVSSAETRQYFPYDFALEMTYALEEGDEGVTLAQTFAVNNADVRMPFFLGGHPAFNVPLAGKDEGAFEDWRLVFSRPWTATTPAIDEAGLLDYGRTREVFHDASSLPLTHELFSQDAIVLEGVPDSTVTLTGPVGHGVHVDFSGFDHVGVWSAAPSADGEPAPFVAIEPWCGTATRTDEDDALEHKQNVIFAEPGETVTRTFRVTPF